jgi:hypothetical protein
VDGVVLSSIAFIALALLLWHLHHRRPFSAAAILFITLWTIYTYVHFNVTWKSDGYREQTALLARLNQRAAAEPDARVLVLGLEPSRLLLYSRLPLEVFVDPDQLRLRDEELEHAYILTSVGLEFQLRAKGMPILLDRMPECNNPFSRLAVYRMEWRPRRRQLMRSTYPDAPAQITGVDSK